MSQSLGELIWALGFDNTGLKKGTQEAGVEFEHMGKTLKEAMANQRILIKEIGLDIRGLALAAKEATNSGKKTEILGDLTAAKKVLADEQARLLDMQKKSVEVNNAEEKSQGGVLSGLGKWAIGLATVAGAMKAFHSIVNSTEGTAKQFEFAVAGAESGLSYFWKTLATGDFSNFFTNMDRAVKSGHDFAKAMHEVKEAGWAQSINEALQSKTNTQNEITLRDTSKPKEVRLAAGETRISDEEKFSKVRTDNAEAELNAWMKVAEERSGIDKEAFVASERENWSKNKLLGILRNVNEETKAEAETYNEKIAKVQDDARKRAGYISLLDAEKKVGGDVSPEVELYAQSLREKATLTEEMILGVVNAAKKVGEADNSAISGLKRVFTTVGGIKKTFEDEDKASAKAALDAANSRSKKQIEYDTELGRQRIDTQIKLDQDLLNTKKDGTEKSLAQADLDYQKTVLAISKQKDKLLKDLNIATGGIDEKSGKKTSSYVSALPETDQKQITDQLALAETVHAAAIVKINDEAGVKLKKLWNEINDARLTGLEKASAAMNEKYDKMVVDAAGNSDALKAIEVERAKANQDLISKFSLKDFQDSIDWASVFGDLDKVSTAALNEFRSKLSLYLSTVGSGISQQDLKTVTVAFKKLNEAIADRTPITELTNSYKDYKEASDKVVEAQNKVNEITKNGEIEIGDLTKANKNLSDAQKDRAASLSQMNKSVNDIGKEGQQLAGAGRDIIDMLGNLGVGVDERVSKALAGFSQSMDGLSSIDFTKPMTIVTGSIKAIAGLVNEFAAIFGGGSKELSQGVIDYYNDLMSTMNDVITIHQKLIAEFSGSMAVSESEKTIELINKQIEATRQLGLQFLASRSAHSHSYGHELQVALDEYKSQLSNIGVDLSDSKGGIGQLFTMSPAQLKQIKEEVPAAWAKIDDQTRAYLQTIIDSKGAIDDTAKALGEALTDLSFDSAKDSLKSLLLSADTTMADIANNFEGYMRNAIVNALITGQLAPLIKQWYIDFTKAMEDGVLSDKEKSDLNKGYNDIGQKGIDMRNAAYAAAGISLTPSSSDSAAGQIKAALTEDTGTALMGLWRRGIDESITQTGILSMSNGYLYAIEINTRRTADNTEFLKTSGTTNGRDKG